MENGWIELVRELEEEKRIKHAWKKALVEIINQRDCKIAELEKKVADLEWEKDAWRDAFNSLLGLVPGAGDLVENILKEVSRNEA